MAEPCIDGHARSGVAGTQMAKDAGGARSIGIVLLMISPRRVHSHRHEVTRSTGPADCCQRSLASIGGVRTCHNLGCTTTR